MKPDSGPHPPDADIEPAHLRDPHDTTNTVFRYPPAPELSTLVRRYWLPVWSVEPGREAPQRVLQYPVCLLVISADHARFHGVTSGLSTTVLTGDGWAAGVMFTPAAGGVLTGRSVAEFTDRHVDLTEVLGDAAGPLADAVRAAMDRDPRDPAAHRAATTAIGAAVRPHLPIDDEGRLVNRIVEYVEDDPTVLRVEQVRREFDLTERTLQRLVHRRIGLTPKWLIQRRRLQEAAGRLREHAVSLADTAAVLGYADQPHFVRDFTRVVGMTPGAFADRFGRPRMADPPPDSNR
ncbi:MAG: helix-turn-helix transcriptional regulator [Rhodococcus sp.]|uniref:helix-turn-helix domain-containing protein n=1 Tax=Rhodococcus TaxID=1827 RepID=UPI0016AA4F0E|nr:MULTISPECIES: AraC family transcriptional regulator [Rhodococcus]NLV79583.1 helix-turn-helix transcriptional regulator [Rhodococcus sp. (in: high G+C Gram-positive bacteria)]